MRAHRLSVALTQPPACRSVPRGALFIFAQTLAPMLLSRPLLNRLRAIVEPVAERNGCELVAVEFIGGLGGRRTLRVSIDRPGGVGIDECTKVSRQLSPVLDVEDPIDGPYDLELSTPGMERPVQRIEDFARFAGCEVRIKPFGADAKRRVKGTLCGVDGELVRVRVAEEERLLSLDEIERAHLVLTITQFQRLGQGLHPLGTGETP